MGTTPTVLNNAVDTTCYSKYPTKNFNWATVDRLGVANVVGAISETWFYFALPFPRGATVLTAVLSLTTQLPYVASTTLTAQRVAQPWSVTALTYNNKPTVEGATAALVKATSTANQKWDFNVQPLLQSVSNGSVWYGFKVTSSSTTLYNYIWSAQAGDPTLRPTLTVTWSDAPTAPSQLFPSGGRAVGVTKPVLQCNFFDVSGDTTMQAMQVQIDDAADFATPTFDSGTVATSVPELNLASTAFGGLTADVVRWWRVRVQDGAGLWSPWSAPTTMVYKTRGTLTLTSPAASPNNTVAEATPPISWTFTGRTQRAFEVVISYDLALATGFVRRARASGKITSALNTWTIPEGWLPFNNQTYTVTLSVWDTEDREATPGDPIPSQVVRTFTFLYTVATAPVTGLTATVNSMFPYTQLDWSRSAQPDKWNIYRDGKLIKTTTTGAELFVSGTAYRFTDYLPEPRKQVTYTVVPVVNGIGSTSNPTVNATAKALAPTLSDVNGTTPVILFNSDTSDMKLTENSAVYQAAGNGPPILITQSERGYQGKISGRLASAGNVSAATFRANFKKLMKNNGITLYLTVVDEAFECFIANPTIRPIARNEEVVYDVSFDFYQTDYAP